MMIALTGSTIDRNTTVSNRNESPNTKRKTIGVYVEATSKKSFENAVWPPTSTLIPVPANAWGMYVSRSFVIACVAASEAGSVDGPASGTSTSVMLPSGATCGGWIVP